MIWRIRVDHGYKRRKIPLDRVGKASLLHCIPNRNNGIPKENDETKKSLDKFLIFEYISIMGDNKFFICGLIIGASLHKNFFSVRPHIWCMNSHIFSKK